ncbi:MAG TPA: Maf family protein [Chthoniobacterales bacterium]|nr:Maf family protein [Chthoniobacterales bacterium]
MPAPSLLLASSSPRRQELLRAAGFTFGIAAPNIREKADPHLTAREVTAWNAMRKGLVIARAHPDSVVLAADTVVALGPEIIGKPNDLEDAVRILRRLTGRTHHVYSSVFVAQFSVANAKMFCEISEVRFRKLNETQIRNYLEKINPLDKAGGYAAQGHGAEIIAKIEGSYSNVVGLPMEKTVLMLEQFGVQPAKGPDRRTKESDRSG